MCCGSQSHKAAGQTSWLWLPAAQAICCPVLPRGANTPHASCFNLKEEAKTKRQARTLHLPHCEQKSSWNRSAETIRGCIWLLETGNSHYLNLNYTATAWKLLPLKGVFFFFNLPMQRNSLKYQLPPLCYISPFLFWKLELKSKEKSEWDSHTVRSEWPPYAAHRDACGRGAQEHPEPAALVMQTATTEIKCPE